MKKILNIFCAAAAIAALASCAKENAGIDGERGTILFETGFDATKTAIDSLGKTTWTKGDKITVFNGNGQSVVCNIPDEAEGKSTATIAAALDQTDKYYGVYGGSDVEIENGTLDITLETSQNGTWAAAQLAVGTNSNKYLNLKNVSSVFEFDITSSDAKSVTFSTEGSASEFVYEAEVSFGEKNAIEIAPMSGTKSITVAVNGAGKYYASWFPCTVQNFTISVEYASQTKSVTIASPYEFLIGNKVNLGNIEEKLTKSYKLSSQKGFSTTKGNLDSEGVITYEAFKGNASTAPGNFNNGIRLYQAPSENTYGGYIELVSTKGDKIKGVKFANTGTYNTKVVMEVDGKAFDINDTIFVKKNQVVSYTGLNASKVTLYNTGGTTSSYRLEIDEIAVSYELDSRTVQELSFPQSSYAATLGGTFEAPVLSGAKTTVTYSTSDDKVATVNASTGAVTLTGAGTCTITATAAESETYKTGFASYQLIVAQGVSGIGGIKTLLRNGEKYFVAQVTDMLVTYTQTAEYPHIAYAEDSENQAIYFYYGAETLPFEEGDKFSGTISGAGTVYNGCVEVTSLDLSGATKTSGCASDTVTVALATLLDNYSTYEYRKCKIEGATVGTAISSTAQSGTIIQNGTTATLRSGQKGFVTTEAGSVIDVICFPDRYIPSGGAEQKQLFVWKQSDVSKKGEVNAITMASTKSIAVGSQWTIGATCKSGDAVSYEIVSGESYISLSAGVVTATAAGTAVIKATSPKTADYEAAEATCTITVTQDQQEIVTLNISKYVTDNKLTISAGSDIGSIVKSIDMDSNLNVAVTGTGNTGSFWGSPTTDWRIYSKSGDEATVTFKAATGKTIVSIKPTYNVNNGGVLKDGSTSVTSGTTYTVNANSISFNVAYNSGKTGQVRFTEIVVTYK